MRSKSDCHLHKTKPRSVFPANRNKDSSSFFSLPAEDFFSKKLQIFSPEETAKKNLHPDEESVSFFSINGGWGKNLNLKIITESSDVKGLLHVGQRSYLVPRTPSPGLSHREGE